MRYLGVDFGLRKIGLATSEGEIAAPLKVLEVSSFKDALEKIKKEAVSFDKIIIGKPDGEVGKKVMKLVNYLRRENIEVESWDETLSSRNALQVMIKAGLRRKKRQIVDAYSAALILQEYLDTV